MLFGNDDSDEGKEYFDVTTEIEGKGSYSVYNVPMDILEPLSNDDELNEAFTEFIDKNYYASETTKELFKIN